MSAAARVRMGEGCFVVSDPEGRETRFTSHDQALDYADLVLREQLRRDRRQRASQGDYRMRKTRRRGGQVFEVVDRSGHVLASLSSEYLCLNKIDSLVRADRLRVRPCLSCKAPFESEGPHNRMCPACNQRAQTVVWI
jgi:hypothetical protein